ncbi:MAG TPA: hypothetical protein VLD57_05395 [Blastocatellia bacterium]|nr:hypothetical protein [Blastocatellia bacterium]
MSAFHQSETLAIKACCSCSGVLLDRDRFCRWCGARQTSTFPPVRRTTSDQEASVRIGSKSLYITSPLEPAGKQADPYRPVSGPLVKAMIEGMAAGESAPLYSQAARAVFQVLVWIPIWLMIVLLSPFDAYAAARSISRHSAHETMHSVCERQPSLSDLN